MKQGQIELGWTTDRANLTDCGVRFVTVVKHVTERDAKMGVVHTKVK